jgi:hypothetical protein
VELNADEITSYALRHSSIVRALLGGVPVAVVAQQHDTSVREIEAHYAAYILDHSDSLSRRALLNTAVPRMADNVMTAFCPPVKLDRCSKRSAVDAPIPKSSSNQRRR